MRTFFITCHRSALSVADLFRFLYRPDINFIIHCDPKAPPELARLVIALAARFPNVRALPPRPFSWAGYSMVETVMDAMRCALDEFADWTHFFWISEQHLPLRAPGDPAWMLDPKWSYAETRPVPMMEPGGQADIAHRFCRVYRELPGVGAFPAGQPDLPQGFLESLRHGSNWMALTRQACHALLRRASTLGSANPFARSLHADETMLQTLLFHDDGEQLPVQPRNLTYVAWPHLSGSQDMIFRSENVPDALAAGCLLIRKRPDQLDDGTVAVTNAFAAMPKMDLERELALCEIAPEPVVPARSIEDVVTVLREFAGQAAIWRLDRDHLANVPACHVVLNPLQASDSLRIGLFSEDLRRFKVVLAVDLPDVPPFEEKLFQGRRTTALRVRLHGFFLTREIEIEIDGQPNHGFIDWSADGGPDGLREALQRAIDTAIACSAGQASPSTRADELSAPSATT